MSWCYTSQLNQQMSQGLHTLLGFGLASKVWSTATTAAMPADVRFRGSGSKRPCQLHGSQGAAGEPGAVLEFSSNCERT